MELSVHLINRNSENGIWRVMGLLIYKLEEHMKMANLSIYLDQIKLDILPKDDKSDNCNHLFQTTHDEYILL